MSVNYTKPVGAAGLWRTVTSGAARVGQGRGRLRMAMRVASERDRQGWWPEGGATCSCLGKEPACNSARKEQKTSVIKEEVIVSKEGDGV